MRKPALRFVVLHHTGVEHEHYDLMLQVAAGTPDDRKLKTFATEANTFPARGCLMRQIQDHRLAYLSFEGAISGGRGTVRRVDTGTWRWLPATDASEAPARVNDSAANWASDVRFVLDGQHFNGTFHLQPQGDRTYKLIQE